MEELMGLRSAKNGKISLLLYSSKRAKTEVGDDFLIASYKWRGKGNPGFRKRSQKKNFLWFWTINVPFQKTRNTLLLFVG